MDETILHVELTQSDVAALLNAADRIYSFIGYAQGAEARYQMRREQIVVTLPVGKNDFPVRTGDLQIDSEAKTREEALYYSQEEIAKMPKLKDGHFRKTPDGYWQVRYRRGGHDIQFTSKKKAVVMDRFREWVRSVDNDEKVVLRKPLKRKTSFAEFAELYFTNVKAVNVKPVTMSAKSYLTGARLGGFAGTHADEMSNVFKRVAFGGARQNVGAGKSPFERDFARGGGGAVDCREPDGLCEIA